MLKKVLKKVSLAVIVAASVGSFIFMNSSYSSADEYDQISISIEDPIPDEHTMQVPELALVKKALVLAKCFLYPTE